MSTSAITPSGSDNPFDTPLPSEVNEHQQATASRVAAGGNPFDEPLPSEKAEAQANTSGQVTNDVGNTIIVPKDGESFADTMKRAAAYGKTVTQDQINKEMATAPKKVAQTVVAAPLIGAGGAAALSGPGELYDLALKHLAGDVLPGMEEMAARAKLAEWAPKVAKAATALGVGIPGLKLLWQAALGGKGK